MISHVQEFTCQYTNQVKKKHKAWQDGRLKYYEASKRFMLYNEDGDTLLSSNFITNEKELNNILDQQGFGSIEHKIFARYVVIIQDLTAEYNRDTRLHKMHGKEVPKVDTTAEIQPHRLVRRRKLIKSCEDVGDTVRDENNGSSCSSNSKIVGPSIQKTGVSHSLALKFDTPFKPPRIRLRPKDIVVNDKNNRPVVRNSVVHLQRTSKNFERTIQASSSKQRVFESKNTTLSVKDENKVPIRRENDVKKVKKKAGVLTAGTVLGSGSLSKSQIRVCLANNLRVKRIIHEPIVLE